MKDNNKLSLSDLNDSAILRENESLLSLLLKDHTTGKNIKWGTDSYINHGYSFRNDQEIKLNLITGWYDGFIRPRVDKDLDDQLERQRNRAEVFTPSWVIKLQVEAALEDMKELPIQDFIQTKWIEITCGEAPYMVNRYDMETGDVIPLNKRSGFIDVKFKRLNKEIEIEDEWVKLALEIYKASYGYEYQGDSLLLARENLILTFIDNFFYMFGAFPNDKLLLEITKIVSINVFQMDGLTYEVPYSDGGAEEFGTQLNLFEEVEEETVLPELAKIRLWKKEKVVKFIDFEERNDLEMKFDVVIGNPPYQGEQPGGRTATSPIYPYFMEAAYKIGRKAILITPARFLFNAGLTNKKWNQKMLSDEHLKVVFYEEDSSKVFSNTDIKGGIAVTYRDKDKTIEPIEVFTIDPLLKQILDKVETISTKSIRSIIAPQVFYKFTKIMHKENPEVSETFAKGAHHQVGTAVINKYDNKIFFEEKPNDDNEYVQIYGLLKGKRVYRWIDERYIEENEGLNRYKVLVPKANGSGNFGERLSTPLVCGPKIGHTQTFISIGNFDKELEAYNCLKYIKSKFSRAMLGILKVTQDNLGPTWEMVPLQNFSDDSDIDWSTSISKIDQQLYEKYKLNEKEIEFIETHVKEME